MLGLEPLAFLAGPANNPSAFDRGPGRDYILAFLGLGLGALIRHAFRYGCRFPNSPPPTSSVV